MQYSSAVARTTSPKMILELNQLISYEGRCYCRLVSLHLDTVVLLMMPPAFVILCIRAHPIKRQVLAGAGAPLWISPQLHLRVTPFKAAGVRLSNQAKR